MAESKWTRHEVQFRGVPNENRGDAAMFFACSPEMTSLGCTQRVSERVVPAKARLPRLKLPS